MFDSSKPVQTRNGKKARIIATDCKNGNNPILALIEDVDGIERPLFYRETGILYSNSENKLDLVNVPETRVRWLCIMKDRNGYYSSGPLYPTEEYARESTGKLTTFVTCVKVEWKE